MNELEKLRVLLPHWIEHNLGHAQECEKWAELSFAASGAEEVSGSLKDALAAMAVVNKCLEKALSAAGGPLEAGEHKHHHHHH